MHNLGDKSKDNKHKASVQRLEVLKKPLHTQPKSILVMLDNNSSSSNKSAKGENHTKGTRKPRDNVLLRNGNACYRRVTQKTAVDPTTVAGTISIKVVQCVAKKDLMKCILTVDDIAGGKTFRNTQKVFRAGDRITIIHSKVYDEYGVGQVAIIQPHRMLGGTTTEKAATTKAVDKEQRKVKKKRQYGRKEKDSSNVWLIVTAKSNGKRKLWQRNMELLGVFLEFRRVEYLEVETTAVGLAADMARVYHNNGGEQHRCYQIQIIPNTALWIDEALFCTNTKEGEETGDQTKEEEEGFPKATETEKEESRIEEEEEEVTEIMRNNEECECTEWMTWDCYEPWDTLWEEGTL